MCTHPTTSVIWGHCLNIGNIYEPVKRKEHHCLISMISSLGLDTISRCTDFIVIMLLSYQILLLFGSGREIDSNKIADFSEGKEEFLKSQFCRIGQVGSHDICPNASGCWLIPTTVGRAHLIPREAGESL